MARRLLSFILICLILGAGCYTLLNTAFLTRWMIRWTVQRACPAWHFQKIDIKAQTFVWPNQLVLTKARFVFVPPGSPAAAAPGDVSVEQCRLRWVSWGELEVLARGILVSYDRVDVRGGVFQANILWNAEGLRDLQGAVHAASVNAQDFKMTNVSAMLKGQKRFLLASHLNTSAYGGQMTGEILLEYAPRLAYIINIDLNQLVFEQLRGYNASLFDGIGGVLQGRVSLRGHGAHIEKLTLDTHLKDGGKMRAAYLAFLAPYLPQSQQRTELEQLARTEGMVPFETMGFMLKTLDEQNLNGLLTLNSRSLNLNLNQTLDIHFDGTMGSLLEFVNQFGASR